MYEIEVGDYVTVYFSNCETLFQYKVFYTPQATGDSWRLVDQNRNLVYVQFFEKMVLITKGEENEQK